MRRSLVVLVLLLSLPAARAAEPDTQAVLDLGEVGAVRVHQRCAPAARPQLERGVALLHSFFYEEARIAFRAAAAADPACATAFWGEAMTHYHPLWAPPAPDEAAEGTKAADRALQLGGKGPVEQGLVDAIHAYWHERLPKGAKAKAGEGTPSCHGGAPTPGGRAQAFRASLEALHRRFPQDVEVTAFYALSLLGTAPKEDRTLAQQRQAAALLERAWARHPRHPGLVHYLIHAYDYPEIAKRGLKAANAYTGLAPRVPHALHMPSHIYVRLGMWDENVQANLRSLEAARRWMAVRHPGGAINFDSFHANDYLGYGYLQQGRLEEARKAVEEVLTDREVYPARQFQVVFARGMLPARWALERDAWAEAAKLQVPPLPGWEDFPFVEGLVAYARGLGAARSGDVAGARAAAELLDARAKATTTGPYAYFGKLLAAHRLAVLGWVAHREGDGAQARRLLTEAADLEDAMGPHPVSPGPLLPARELLGDLLLERGEPAAARAAYDASLARYPGRLRSLGGAMRASADDAPLRRRYAQRVLDLAGRGQAPVVAEAAKVALPPR